MIGPVDSSLRQTRRWIVIGAAIAVCMTAVTTARDGIIASGWSNATGWLLGGLAGTYIGEQLARFAQRSEATSVVWLQMAALALLIVYGIVFSALPAYCQLPVSFAMGIVLIATIVYIRRLRIR